MNHTLGGRGTLRLPEALSSTGLPDLTWTIRQLVACEKPLREVVSVRGELVGEREDEIRDVG
jgi:hypothetical protein